VVYDWLRNLQSFQSGSPGSEFKKTLLTQAVAGSTVGLLEVALLPVDTLKIKYQTLSSANLRQQRSATSALQIHQLYRGAGWTAARNMPGQFALFGGNSLAKSAMGIEATATGVYYSVLLWLVWLRASKVALVHLMHSYVSQARQRWCRTS
jgi:hypothetical protein